VNKEPKFLTVMNVIAAGIEKGINFFGCVFLALVAIAVVIQVFGRTVNIPVVWLGELSVFAVIWAVFFGLAVSYKHGMLAQVDLILHLTPKSWEKPLRVFWDLTGLALMTVILISSRGYVFRVWERKTLSPELRLPLFAVYLGPVLGYIFTIYFTLINIITRICTWRREDEPC
jgi:TRAP-type C4-dicarboxylate transport system permease small subunit